VPVALPFVPALSSGRNCCLIRNVERSNAGGMYEVPVLS
jgi:hypothetical protein